MKTDLHFTMRNADEILCYHHRIFSVTPFLKLEVNNFILIFNWVLLYDILPFRLVYDFIEISRKFHFFFKFLPTKSCTRNKNKKKKKKKKKKKYNFTLNDFKNAQLTNVRVFDEKAVLFHCI